MLDFAWVAGKVVVQEGCVLTIGGWVDADVYKGGTLQVRGCTGIHA
jgi:hypothetical protein